jgi:hypothetical protein
MLIYGISNKRYFTFLPPERDVLTFPFVKTLAPALKRSGAFFCMVLRGFGFGQPGLVWDLSLSSLALHRLHMRTAQLHEQADLALHGPPVV